MENETTDSAVLSVTETARYLRLGKNNTYAAIARGEIPSIRIGNRILIPKTAIARMLEQAGAKPAVNKK